MLAPVLLAGLMLGAAPAADGGTATEPGCLTVGANPNLDTVQASPGGVAFCVHDEKAPRSCWRFDAATGKYALAATTPPPPSAAAPFFGRNASTEVLPSGVKVCFPSVADCALVTPERVSAEDGSLEAEANADRSLILLYGDRMKVLEVFEAATGSRRFRLEPWATHGEPNSTISEAFWAGTAVAACVRDTPVSSDCRLFDARGKRLASLGQINAETWPLGGNLFAFSPFVENKQGGKLLVVDAKTGRTVRTHPVDLFSKKPRQPYMNIGAVASLAKGGTLVLLRYDEDLGRVLVFGTGGKARVFDLPRCPVR